MRILLPELFANEAITPEKAWWLGILLGDGNVHWSDKHGNYRVSVVGSLSTVTRWLNLLDPTRSPQAMKRSPGTYQGYVDSKPFCTYLRDTYGLCGPKTHALPWIETPSDVFVHFARGLWDSDGYLSIDRRRHLKNKGNDCPVAGFGVSTEDFTRRFRDELRKALDLPRVAIVKDGKVAIIKWGGKPALKLADWLYADAPEHLRNEDRVGAYRELCELRDRLGSDSCPSCGALSRLQGYCYPCWWSRKKKERRLARAASAA